MQLVQCSEQCNQGAEWQRQSESGVLLQIGAFWIAFSIAVTSACDLGLHICNILRLKDIGKHHFLPQRNCTSSACFFLWFGCSDKKGILTIVFHCFLAVQPSDFTIPLLMGC